MKTDGTPLRTIQGRDINNWQAMAEQFAKRGLKAQAAECLLAVAKLQAVAS